MGVGSWVLWSALAVTALALSLWHYRRRETPGRGRTALALLRAVTLAILLLLLFDPELPAGAVRAPRGTQVLLDASLSMTLPAESAGSTRWDRAVAMARQRAGDRPVLLFGDRPRPVRPDSLPAALPSDGRSRMLPALQAAAEAGVRRVVVITDGAIEDADDIARWAPRLGIEVEPVRIGGNVANRTLAEVSAPAWLEAGQPAVVEFGVAGGAADTLRVVARRDDHVIGRAAAPGAPAGRLATGRLELMLEPPPGGGWVRLEVALEGNDAVPDDDVRTAYIHVSDEPAGIALVSLRPDWESRFLAPVLQQALGLPLRGWLRGTTGQYIRLGSGLDAGVRSGEEGVRRAVERAELVVLHGVGADAPSWVIAALTSARRLLVFPADPHGGVPLPLPVGTEQQAEFYVAPSVPPSPVAGLLAGVEQLSGSAPLTGLRSAELPPEAWAPLLVTRSRQGVPLPLAAAAEQGGRRWVVALGSGYWNWQFRGGAERQLYERLWGSLAGWLVRQRGTASLAAVRPATPAAPRATPVPWLAPGIVADSIHVQLADASGATVLDTVVAPTAADTAFVRPPEPGHYSYRARAFVGDTIIEATGPLTIERYSPELDRPVVELGTLQSGVALVRGDGGRRSGTPLHAVPYPYLVLLGVLAAEWILRRRWGLR
jgi:hypothetical protein